MSALRRAYALLFVGESRLLAISTGLAILQTLALIPVTLCVKVIFATELPHHDANKVLVLGLIVVALYVASAAVQLWSRRVLLTASKRAMARLRLRLFQHVQLLPRSYFDHQSVNDVYGVMVLDSERLNQIVITAGATVLPAVIVIFGLSLVALVVDPLLMLVVLALVPLLVGTTRVVGRWVWASARSWQLGFDEFGKRAQLAIRSVTLRRVLGTVDTELGRSQADVEELAETGFHMAWGQSVLGTTQQTLAAAVGIAVLVVGGYQVASNRLSLGALMAFYVLMALMLRQLGIILNVLPGVVTVGVSLERIEALLGNCQRVPYSGNAAIQLRGEVELRDVTFGYVDEPVLRGVSLTVAAGEHLAIVGPNGAGKSTLVNLLLGHDRPWSGQLLADGVGYDEIDLATLYAGLGYVPQLPILFPESVEENIRCGRADIDDSEILDAAARAGVTSVLDRLVAGMDTEAGEEGNLISAGQRQRIAVARALAGSPKLLVLDEPTTHLDSAGIRDLLTTLRALPQQPTVIVITHDPVVVDYVDRVVELRDGQIHDAAGHTPQPRSGWATSS